MLSVRHCHWGDLNRCYVLVLFLLLFLSLILSFVGNTILSVFLQWRVLGTHRVWQFRLRPLEKDKSFLLKYFSQRSILIPAPSFNSFVIISKEKHLFLSLLDLKDLIIGCTCQGPCELLQYLTRLSLCKQFFHSPILCHWFFSFNKCHFPWNTEISCKLETFLPSFSAFKQFSPLEVYMFSIFWPCLGWKI